MSNDCLYNISGQGRLLSFVAAFLCVVCFSLYAATLTGRNNRYKERQGGRPLATTAEVVAVVVLFLNRTLPCSC